MLEFGASFKKARESKNVSLDKIAVETRISSRFLVAIENEQFELLPGGIFNRGFIRTYAERLGLDPEEAITAYEKLSQPVEPDPVRQEAPPSRGKTTKVPLYITAVVGLAILIGGYYIATRSSEPNRVAVSPPAAAPVAPKPDPAPVSEEAAEPETETTTVATSTAAAATPAPLPTPSAAPASSGPTPPKAATPPTPVPQAPQTAVSQSAANAPVVIEVEVREESWFKLSSDGAVVVVSEILPAGTVRRYTANTSMDVSIGNAGGVTLRVNGQPVSSLGKSGQVREMMITAKTSAASLAFAAR